ncbi:MULTISPECIES: hypothetical protein [Pseudoalteromonas]|nr:MULTISPECIES: hypothetical protein [Pseudoalteromonas]KZN40113.1 hypothetical protein N483_18160 [Pseudoalteromonas luteoviolacea NCIMB 1944]MCG7551198.1 hypothetical protein [Pseudoalteromonas sp. Of7M-16]
MLLTDVTIDLYHKAQQRDETKSILHELFPGSKVVKANWYSGALVVPHGKRTRLVHMGYGSSYEEYIVIRVNKGTVVEFLNLSGEEFAKYKARKFQAFKGTSEFQQKLKNLIEEEHRWSEEDALYFMESFYAEYYLSL